MHFDSEQKLKLNWLSRIRFGALIGELIVFLMAIGPLSLKLTSLPVISILSIGLISNLALIFLIRRERFYYSQLVGPFLILDIFLLTGLLYFYGGHTNPFSTMYLVHVTIAAFLLGASWTWSMFFISSISYALLFFFNTPVPELAQHHHGSMGSGFTLHLQGMLLGFLLIGSLLSFFLTQMSREVKVQNEELKRLKDKESFESKMLGLATLAGGAAHELATPIGTIALISEDLRRQFSNEDKLLLEIDAIDREVDRCQIILDKMRARGSELQGEVPELLSVEDVYTSVVKSLEDIKDRIVFICNCKNIKILSLKKSLVEAIAALIKNGIQASTSSQLVEVSAKEENDSILFSIADSGAGIRSEFITRIGEPFFTTKDPGEGMGLGLFLVNAFAKRVGGYFKLLPNNKSGATALLCVPKRMESL